MNVIIIVLALFQMTSAKAEGLSPHEIVTRSDQVRNPGQSFQVQNQLTEYISGTVHNKLTLDIYTKEDKKTGQFRNLVRYVDPPRDSGKLVLLDDAKMWFYDPSSKSSVRISPQQRLLGQAAEGDVVAVNLSKDYKAVHLGDEDLKDAGQKSRKCWHLELKPLKSDAIYGRIEYWVEKSTYHPIKGKFYSDSGRLLKIAYYHRYEVQLGALRPTEVIIIDGIHSNLVTTMSFSGFRMREVSDRWFQREFLPHFKSE